MNRLGQTKWLNVLQGSDWDTAERWYQGVKEFSDPKGKYAGREAEGLAMGGAKMCKMPINLRILITLKFEGKAEAEKAIVAKIDGDQAPALKVGDVIVQIDPRYYRPTEVETLLGDPTKAKEKLGWVPEITLDEMIVEMVASDLEKAKQHALLEKHGYSVLVGKEN
jgi:hypothetical protein